jgi:hypothetical protein
LAAGVYPEPAKFTCHWRPEYHFKSAISRHAPAKFGGIGTCGEGAAGER